jgi:hypothetical protein
LTEGLDLLNNKRQLNSTKKKGVFNLVEQIWTYKEGPCSIVFDESIGTTVENRDEAKE